MTSRAVLDAYRDGMLSISGDAEEYVRSAMEWGWEHGLSPAEMREMAIEVIMAASDEYGSMERELARQLYERQTGQEAHVGQSTVNREAVEKNIRYYTRYLDGTDGGFDSFLRACTEQAGWLVRRDVNDQVINSCGKTSKGDKRRKRYRHDENRYATRFARVPQGGDTCTFCAMLASRGFVYWTRESAGEFSHYHKHCRCLIVPDDGTGEVEGYDPDEWLARWQAFEEIDAGEGTTTAQKEDAKRLIASGRAATFREVEAIWREEAKNYAANLGVVQSKAYRAAISEIIGDDALADRVWKDARHTLKVRGGTPYENLYAYDLTQGTRLASITDSTERLSVTMDDTMKRAVEKASGLGHDIALMHNHPGSSDPSGADIVSLARCGAGYGLIACHDGTLVRFSVDAAKVAEYKAYNSEQAEALGYEIASAIKKRLDRGKTVEQAYEAVRMGWGVSFERISVSL